MTKQYTDKYGLQYPYYEQCVKSGAVLKDKMQKDRKMLSETMDSAYTDLVQRVESYNSQRYRELLKKLADIGLVDSSTHPDTAHAILISLIEGK